MKRTKRKTMTEEIRKAIMKKSTRRNRRIRSVSVYPRKLARSIAKSYLRSQGVPHVNKYIGKHDWSKLTAEYIHLLGSGRKKKRKA